MDTAAYGLDSSSRQQIIDTFIVGFIVACRFVIGPPTSKFDLVSQDLF